MNNIFYEVMADELELPLGDGRLLRYAGFTTDPETAVRHGQLCVPFEDWVAEQVAAGRVVKLECDYGCCTVEALS
jgi:hypothetical protein